MRRIAGLLALGLLCSFAPAASAAPAAQITTATVDAAWTKAHVGGSVSCSDCAGSSTYVDWLPVVTVQPSLPEYYCRGDEWADSDPNTRVLWTGGKQVGNAAVPFDLVDAAILPGVFGQRVCASVVHTSRYQEPLCLAQAPILGYPPSSCPLVDHIVDSPLAGAILAVDQVTTVPPPSAPPPAPPSTAAPVSNALSLAKARSSAKAALRASLGRRWIKGINKRLICVRTAPHAFRCSAGWRYRGKRLSRRVSVSRHDGQLTVRVRR